MITETLALVNIFLGIFDCYLTQRRIKDYGPKIELNRLVRYLSSTHMGPLIASLWGVLLPNIAWTCGLYFFDLSLPLAFLTGFNLKRFFVQLTSIELEKNARVYELLQEFGSANSATLPEGELTPTADPSISKRVSNVHSI